METVPSILTVHCLDLAACLDFHTACACRLVQVGLAAAAAGEEPLGRTKFSVGLSDTGIVTCGATSFNLRPHMWFGAGCAVSIVCDVDRDLIYFAINGQLISNEFVPRTRVMWDHFLFFLS